MTEKKIDMERKTEETFQKAPLKYCTSFLLPLSHQCAYCKEVGPWYLEVKMKALFRNVSDSWCSMSP